MQRIVPLSLALLAALILGGCAIGAAVHLNGTKPPDRSVPTANPSTPRRSEAPSASPTPAPTPAPTVSFIFGGDIMLGRQLERNMRRYGNAWPLSQLGTTMQAADITAANLESPLSSTAGTTPSGSLILRGYPPGIENLTEAGVDAVSLANNHVTDMGADGVAETLTDLANAGIAYAGAGLSANDAAAPAILERNGLKVGFLSYAYGVNIERPGIFYNKADPARVAADVAALKPKVGVVVVFCHCGIEYHAVETASQEAFARAAIDAGALMVIGHHPHVPEPVEKYKDGLIIYSLGNLVFDQDPGGNRDVSALASVTIQGDKLVSLSLLPYRIYGYGQPRLVDDPVEKERIWGLFKLPGGRIDW